MDSNNKIIKICIKKDEFEQEICKHNIKHFTKAYNTKIYQDRIYTELRNNEIRDKILNRQLLRDDYDNEEVWKFLLLFKRSRNHRNKGTNRF